MADFTEIYKQSGSLCAFSPSGAHIATAVQYRCVVRDAETLQILHLFPCLDTIQDLVWSPDSTLIACACYRSGSVSVFSLQKQEWTAKIDEGLGGVVKVLWSPDARHLLCFSEFQLRVTVWSLVSKDAMVLQYPKYSDRGYDFRKDGKYLVMAQRIDCKDYVCVYDTADWELLKDLRWSPDGRFIAIWEPSVEYNILIYYPDGRLVKSFSAYDEGLGIKTVSWAPSGQFLGVGSYDGTVRLLNYYTWKPLVEMTHPIHLKGGEIHVFKEIDLAEQRDGVASARPKLKYELLSCPIQIPIVKSDPEKPNPRMGVGILEFSCDGRYMVSRNDNMPTCLWIWDMLELKHVSLIQQTSGIKSLKWNPLQPGRLAYCCGNGCLYLWESEMGCESIEVPAVNFKVQSLSWNHDGKSLVLMDSDKFCLAFPIDE